MEAEDSRGKRMISNEFRFDTYRDMLHDNGFCIKPCVFSQASTWTANHINNDTDDDEEDSLRSDGSVFFQEDLLCGAVAE